MEQEVYTSSLDRVSVCGRFSQLSIAAPVRWLTLTLIGPALVAMRFDAQLPLESRVPMYKAFCVRLKYVTCGSLAVSNESPTVSPSLPGPATVSVNQSVLR